MKALVEKVKRVVASIATKISEFFHNIVNKVKNYRKNAKNTTKTQKKVAKSERIRVIMGIGQLFVVVSIAYSTYVVFIGVDSVLLKVVLIPQVIFAGATLLKAFSKLYK